MSTDAQMMGPASLPPPSSATYEATLASVPAQRLLTTTLVHRSRSLNRKQRRSLFTPVAVTSITVPWYASHLVGGPRARAPRAGQGYAHTDTHARTSGGGTAPGRA